ncbi:TetR/AcrR family transcriptional regulator [Nocardioides sp. SYSU DS0651]|uniref:TetR/AcrR family transcriptional regulator n=1 Tax=Nocardioides sp. SYSU DS0651 TaxID=3415955 RepID=UPI003F4B0580
MANLRSAQKAMTRGLLLEAALQLFRDKGYAATTVDDIATAAGTTRVTFYAYFTSKADVVRALMVECLNEVLRRTSTPEGGSTALDLVHAVADGRAEAIGSWLRQTSELWPLVRPIIRIGRDAAAAEPELRGLVGRWLEEAISDIAEGLELAGRFEPHQRHFRGVLAMAELDYVAQHWGDNDWRLDREQMLTELSASWARLLGEPTE